MLLFLPCYLATTLSLGQGFKSKKDEVLNHSHTFSNCFSFLMFFNFRVSKELNLSKKSEKSCRSLVIDANKTLENERRFSQAYQNH